MMGLNLHDLRMANVERQCHWDPDGQISPLYTATEFAGEAGEVCNEVKKLERERMGLKGSRTTVEKLGEELADAVICADLIAAKYGIDLSEAVAKKFNSTSLKVGLPTFLPV